MRTRNADLTVRMVDFDQPGVGTNKYMTKDSFVENVINNEYTQKRIDNGMLKALLTHQGRDYANSNRTGTPYDDLLATHPDLCGVIRDVWIDDHSAYAAIDLLNTEAFPAAAKVKDLIKKGTYVGVSMATECEQDSHGNFNIKELLGCDFTLDNYFIGSGIISIKKNFSNGQSKNFVNFSNKDTMIKSNIEVSNFNLKTNLIEARKPYAIVFNMRVREVERTLGKYSLGFIKQNKDTFAAYINDMIYNWISKALNSEGKINLNLGLRLNRVLGDNALVSKFNRKLNLIKRDSLAKGFLTRMMQAQLAAVTWEIVMSVWGVLCKKANMDPNALFKSDNQEIMKNRELNRRRYDPNYKSNESSSSSFPKLDISNVDSANDEDYDEDYSEFKG